MVANRLSEETTSARPIGSRVNSFTTVPQGHPSDQHPPSFPARITARSHHRTSERCLEPAPEVIGRTCPPANWPKSHETESHDRIRPAADYAMFWTCQLINVNPPRASLRTALSNGIRFTTRMQSIRTSQTGLDWPMWLMFHGFPSCYYSGNCI